MRPVRLALIALVAALLAHPAGAAEELRLALQATGTTVWEMAVVSAYGLDKEAGLDLKITELASPEAACGDDPFQKIVAGYPELRALVDGL